MENIFINHRGICLLIVFALKKQCREENHSSTFNFNQRLFEGKPLRRF